MVTYTTFLALFADLKVLLLPYAPPLVVTADGETQYILDTPPSPAYPHGMFFGKVEIRKNYVSYHLMPVYMFPDLINEATDRLKKRMQGKSCFNFTTIDPTMRDELTRLTKACFDRLLREQPTRSSR